jgi:hypothetical protein
MTHPYDLQHEDATWTIPQDLFDKLLAALTARADITKKVLGALIGSFSAQGVDFSYTYAPNTGLLDVHIVAKHGFKANIASNQIIFETLNTAIGAALDA